MAYVEDHNKVVASLHILKQRSKDIVKLKLLWVIIYHTLLKIYVKAQKSYRDSWERYIVIDKKHSILIFDPYSNFLQLLYFFYRLVEEVKQMLEILYKGRKEGISIKKCRDWKSPLPIARSFSKVLIYRYKIAKKKSVLRNKLIYKNIQK